ncbi:MAG: ribonuclease III [Planctomycetota bacterium]|nr:ribonuclease III [Planctomycetota bacterium]
MTVDHPFEDPQLLKQALTHASTDGPVNNERLEFLGDAALDLVIAEHLYRAHPDLAEGELTERKAWIVSRHSLAEAARRLGLEDLALVGRGLDRRALSRSVLANLYEAVLGAIYLDAGLDVAAEYVQRTLAPELVELAARTDDRPAASPKQLFQELCQRDFGALPRYEQVEVRGEAHSRAFLMRAVVAGNAFPTAWGRNRKEAERWAALEALFVIEREVQA